MSAPEEHAALDARIHEVLQRLDVLAEQVEETRVSLFDAVARVHADMARREERDFEVLRVIHDDERRNRQRVNALRATPEYEAAFTEDEPLVSIVIPTHDRFELLRDRSLPSALAQTYERFEIRVVGDAAPPETEEVVRSFGDDRLHYFNVAPHRMHQIEPVDRWRSAGTIPYNEGLWTAQGSWITPFADDDILRPDAIESMLAFNRGRGVEFGYGQVEARFPDGRVEEPNHFPPELFHTSLLGGLFLTGLRFIDYDLSCYLFEDPNDWSQVRRMAAAGVRIGFNEHVVAEYFPSMRAHS